MRPFPPSSSRARRVVFAAGVLLESCASPEAAGQMARFLLDALAEPLELECRRVTVSARPASR